MGLDWMLHGSKPKPGYEKQFHRINDKLAALETDAGLADDKKKQFRSDLELALKSVSISPYEVVGAPRVGIDADATEWFRKQVYEPVQLRLSQESNPRFIAYWRRPFSEIVEDERGKYVVELAKEREGVAAITGMLCSSLDFRGKVVALSAMLPEELKNEAYDDHSGDECLDYADRIEAALREVSEEHVEEVADVTAAVKWLRYWGSRGFGYGAWY